MRISTARWNDTGDPIKAMEIQHNEVERRFEVGVGGARAVLKYETSGGVVIVSHTEVPPALRGQGIAQDLVRAALAWIDQTGKQVDARCDFAAKFIDRHPEFHRLRAAKP